MPFFRFITCAVVMHSLFALTGCGDGKTEVIGTVTVDGKPLEKGNIAFYPVDGQTTTAGAEIKSGSYRAQVSPGAMMVKINAPKVVGQKKLYPHDPKSAVMDDIQEALPAKYNDRSELKVEISRSSNRHDFPLTSH